MYRDAYWILRVANRITISGPVLCFRAWRPRLRSKCDTHAYLHYKNVLENGKMKISSWTSKSHYSVGVYATCRDQKLVNLVGGTQCLNFATNTEMASISILKWFSSMLTKFLNATISFLIPVCLPTTTCLPLHGFLRENFQKSVKKIQVWLKSGKHNGYFTLRPTDIYN